MALVELFSTVRDERTALEYLQQEDLMMGTAPTCDFCGRDMTLVMSGEGHRHIWRCPTHKGHKISVRMGSFWDKQHLSLQTSLQLMLLWAFKTPVSNIEGLIGVAEKTTIQWFEFYRGVCSWWLTRNPRQIGGPGVVVEIDESLMAKRKNNVGHVVQQRWVFGAVCPATNEGFLQFVPDRTAGTLLPLIQRHIAPGSVIHSDGHGAYNTIATLPVVPPYQHLVVIHNQNFVDPVSGACTNHVECYWKNAKRRFKSMAGVHNSLIESHLDEFMWREIHGKSNSDAWLNIKRHIAMRYPTP